MRKRNNPHANARKVSIVTSATINWIYKNRQRKHQVARGEAPTFQPQPRSWGNRVKGCPLVEHVAAGSGEARIYLEAMVQPSKIHEHFFDPDTHEKIDRRVLAPFLNDRIGELRDYHLANIAELTLNGIRYTIAPAATELQKYFPAKPKAAASLTRSSTNRTSGKRQPAKGAS